MFGFRPDGRRVSSIDPIVGITPYLMPMRCDAQVFLQHRVDYELLTRYIAAQAAKGEKITFMQIITAAFVRTVSQHPEINRFILNKQFFARNMCAVSFTMLKNPQNAEMGETAVKVKYDLTDTIYDVRDRMEMVYKEQNILFPICAVNFTEDEWFEIYHDSKDYAACLGIEHTVWEAGERKL